MLAFGLYNEWDLSVVLVCLIYRYTLVKYYAHKLITVKVAMVKILLEDLDFHWEPTYIGLHVSYLILVMKL